MSRIQFTLCGSHSSEEELNPYKVTEPPVRQEILSLINLKPQIPEEIADQLKLPQGEVIEHLEALAKPELVERVGQRFKPTFAIFTAQDQEKLKPLIDQLSRSLAEVVEQNMDSVRSTYLRCGFSEHDFPFDEVAYILVGAYVLDYGGLKALSKAGFLLVSKPMPGGNYIFKGLEGEMDLRANWQWGHSTNFGRFTFFSHGQLPPNGRRRAFPDQAWRWLGEGRPEEEVTAAMEELGEILLALYERPATVEELAIRTSLEVERLKGHLGLLQELEYVTEEGKRFIPCSPVIAEEELVHIWKLAELIQGEFISKILKSSWPRLEGLYRETSPARNGIELTEAFNLLYHLIFERALRSLLKQEVIAYPPLHTDGARYAVWEVIDRHWE